MKITIHKNSICIVWDGDEKKTLGTGFSFLNLGWFITAKHVVEKNGMMRENIKLGFLDGENASCKVAAVHPELDLALIIQEGNPVCDTPLMPGHHKYINSEGLYYIGYSPKQSVGNDSSVVVNHIKDYEVEYRERSNTETLLHFPAVYAEGGNSGGPILGEGGAVVAVIIQKYEDSGTTYCRATDINILLEGLKYNEHWQL